MVKGGKNQKTKKAKKKKQARKDLQERVSCQRAPDNTEKMRKCSGIRKTLGNSMSSFSKTARAETKLQCFEE